MYFCGTALLSPGVSARCRRWGRSSGGRSPTPAPGPSSPRGNKQIRRVVMNFDPALGKFRLAIGCAVILALSAAARGEGGPPLIGDDPGTPGNGNWEINVPYLYQRTSQQTTIDVP